MKPTRVGVLPVAVASAGGIFQYSQVMLDVLAELRPERPEQFVVFGDGLSPSSPVLAGHRWELQPLRPPSGVRRLLQPLHRLQARFFPGSRESLLRMRSAVVPPHGPPADGLPRRDEAVRSWLARCRIDVMLHLAPTPIAFEAATPFVLAVHDLQHRIHPEFPEVGSAEELAWREYVFRNGIGEALVVLVDSEAGKEDVLEHYGELIDPERVRVLPFLPATPPEVPEGAVDMVRRRYSLPDKYLFYPAQLWPHKNHLRIVEALALVRRTDGIELDLVLVGSTAGDLRGATWNDVQALASANGLRDRIHHLGYVSANELAALYHSAVALVMPTFFGPTNIPILEAWGSDCPVITSDIRGVREQAGDAALLVDPESSKAIAAAIRRLATERGLSDTLRERGRMRLAAYTRADYAARLSDILDQVESLLG
jgi:glycosyltransferase involved in cell wall biosynthesis